MDICDCRCNRECRQSRHRQCLVNVSSDVCSGSVLVQQRTCRKGRCKRKAFHVVLPPKRESLKHPSQSDVRVLLSLNSIFYSSWARWTPCTKSCTTRRYRYRFGADLFILFHPCLNVFFQIKSTTTNDLSSLQRKHRSLFFFPVL